jgi:hypothetical protein
VNVAGFIIGYNREGGSLINGDYREGDLLDNAVLKGK